MAFLPFLLQAVIISLSGVMAPGPVTAATIGKGSQSPHAGALVAVGHGIVEFPLMVAIFFGFGRFLHSLLAKAAISLLGGLVLVLLAVDMLRGVKDVDAKPRDFAGSPVVAGILLSLGNPYFLVWRTTAGATLILRSVQFGLVGFLFFALSHWWCDFFWSYLLSALSFRGGQFFGQRFQKTAFVICGAFLLFFSAQSILDAVPMLSASRADIEAPRTNLGQRWGLLTRNRETIRDAG